MKVPASHFLLWNAPSGSLCCLHNRAITSGQAAFQLLLSFRSFLTVVLFFVATISSLSLSSSAASRLLGARCLVTPLLARGTLNSRRDIVVGRRLPAFLVTASEPLVGRRQSSTRTRTESRGLGKGTMMSASKRGIVGTPSAVAATSSVPMDEEEDEFGSADFLDSFDVDAAVQNNKRELDCASVTPAKNPHAASPGGKRARATALQATSSSSETQTVVQPNLVAGTPVTVGSQVDMSEYDISDDVLMGLNMPLPTTTTQTAEVEVVNESEHDAPDTALDAALLETLKQYFGHESFREGQLDCIRTLVRSSLWQKRRDVAVFWSTGSGKSICYQVPPLHLGKIAVVVSPLISLMEDQVSKINGLLDQGSDDGDSKDLAVFLGSAQADAAADEKALRGDYQLVYLTPEKLLSRGFLDALGRLHHRTDREGTAAGDNICLLAIDESHCVSEWGHDFRPEYRKMGGLLQSHPVLSRIPMVALTATAVPRVQKDILQTLGMTKVRMLRQSFDRSNLAIQVFRKPSSGGFRTALQGLVEEIQKEGRGGRQSTIIYAVTRDQVDEIAQWLASQFASEQDDDEEASLTVQAYHAGLSAKKRSQVHTNFLIGRTPIIVATVAFGMGIDKPDTRRVIHYGPPQTLEAYYQQIGRAGRDGMPATVTMFCNDADFARYKDDFYLGGLSAEARVVAERSTDALRDYAMDEEACRRASLLHFFEEAPSFGERCGTCDACLNLKKYADDIIRDFSGKGARVVLQAVGALNGQQGLTVIEKVMGGKIVEDYRYGYGQVAEQVQAAIGREKEAMDRKVALSYFRELLPALVNRGYLQKGEKKKSSPKGVYYATTWATYELTRLGQSVLEGHGPILLPVPQALREMERVEEEKRLQTLQTLRESGIAVDKMSKEDLERDDVLSALRRWNSYMEGVKRSEAKEAQVARLENLQLRMEQWRLDMAVRYRMAPVSVAAEHLLLRIAYMVATLPAGTAIDRNALLATGLRSGGVDDLVETLQEWSAQSPVAATDDGSDKAGKPARNMILDDQAFCPAAPWKYAIYKPQKKTGMAAWEGSYNRFVQKGEHPQTIAVSQDSGRPIQVTTVLNHILESLLHGKELPLARLKGLVTFPNEAEWQALKKAETEMKMDAAGNPETSGYRGGMFRISDLLRPIMGDEFADKETYERTDEESEGFRQWCERTRPYLALRRAGYEPQFEVD